MRNCIQEGTLQAWVDGELAVDQAAKVAAHVNDCLECAESAREVEAENLIVTERLATEFSTAIPTERLRERVEKAVNSFNQARVPVVNQLRSRAVRQFFSFRTLAYVSIAAAILLGGFVGFGFLTKERSAPVTAKNNSATQGNSFSPAPPISQSPTLEPTPTSAPRKTKAVRGSKAVNRGPAYEADARSLSWQEQQYDYAISKLNEAIKIQPPLRPSLQVEYEYNMAVIDNEIATSREVARRNPSDLQAAQFMLAAYQSKVDLMNQIANAPVPEK